MKYTSGVNFINIVHTKVFYAALLQLQFGFVILRQKIIGAKTAYKILMKLTTLGSISSAFYVHVFRTKVLCAAFL